MPQEIDRVVLLHDYSEALGGASYLVQVLLDHLRARNIPVTFFAGDSGTNFHRTDVEFIPLHGTSLLERSKLGALTAGFFNPPSLLKVRDWIGRNDTPGTVYHVHGWTKILTPAIFGALRPVSQRVILHAHDYFNACPNGAFFNYMSETDCRLTPLSSPCLTTPCDKASYAQKLWRSGREVLRRGLQMGSSNVNRMLLIHPGQAPNFELAGWERDKLAPVRNPVTPFMRERVASERNAGIVFIGRISKEKGADLAAAAAAAAGMPITFVGDGSETALVRSLNPDAVLIGRQDRTGVARALAQARLAVMPSRWAEPFGLVALEAIGSGVPAIVSDRALIAGEIERSGFGLSIDTGDLTAFVRALVELRTDDARIARMSASGHTGFLELCNTPEGWTRQIVDHYSAALNGSASRASTAEGRSEAHFARQTG